jgi:hypothetical protein
LAHHDGQRLWMIASSVVMPLKILMAPLHPNTMGNAPTRRFGRNQQWGRVIGGFCRSKFNRFFYTQQSTADMAASIACGAAISNPHGATSSKHHGQCPNASVWLESTVGASNWGGSAKQIKSFFYTQQSTGLWLIASPVTWLPVAVATVALVEALVGSGGNGGRGRGRSGGRGDDGGSGYWQWGG